jgi:hypothetical protein
MHATISVATCLARQKKKPRSATDAGGPLECQNCEQGKLAAAGKLNDDDVLALREEHVTAPITDQVKVCKVEGCDNPAKPNGYCSSCFGKMGNKGLRSKQAAEKAMRAGDGRLTPATIQGSQGNKDTVISVDFGGHEEILEGLRLQAEEQIRPVEAQIIWLVKEALNG